MPNLVQNTRLMKQYGFLPEEQLEKLEKSLGMLVTAADQSHIELNPDWVAPFINREQHHVVLAFLDLTQFSTRTHEQEAGLIAQQLDRYYEIAVPLIYKHGGMIEKIVGDGIIALFGNPFLQGDVQELILAARSFGGEVLLALESEGMVAKMALHDGEVMYFTPLSPYYMDYTVVGEPLTELFRLEGIAKSGRICVYDTPHGRYPNFINSVQDGRRRRFERSAPETVSLQGLGKRKVLYIRPHEDDEDR